MLRRLSTFALFLVLVIAAAVLPVCVLAQAPRISVVTPTSGVPGTIVTITGTGFGSTQGSGTVQLGGLNGTVVSWTDTQIVATVATGAGSGWVRVIQTGTSNGVPFSMAPPTLTSLNPSSGGPGTQVTLTGSGFGTNQGSGTVRLGSINGMIASWSDTQIIATVAPGAGTANALVSQNGINSNGLPFYVTPAVVTGVSPTSGVPGTQVTITGSGFGTAQGSGSVRLGSINGTVVSWNDSQVVATVAAGSTAGWAQILQNGAYSNGLPFSMIPATVSSVTPSSGSGGTQVTITGTHFGTSQGSAYVRLGTVNATIGSWSDAQIVATVSAGSGAGFAFVFQNGISSNAIPFTSTPPPATVVSATPSIGAPGTQVTITGSGFGATPGSSQVQLGSKWANVVTWSDAQIVATVASGAISGIAAVKVGTNYSNYLPFTMAPAAITTVTPTTLSIGGQVTITGSGFGGVQGSSGQVYLGPQATQLAITSWSDAQIVGTVQVGTKPGQLYVNQNGVGSNTIPITVAPAAITSVTPTTMAPGTQITIAGYGFGAAQGSGQVFIGSQATQPAIVSWSNTQIVATVAAGTLSGALWMQQNGVTSNSIPIIIAAANIASVSPVNGPVGTQVTITGTGFGTSQGSGSVYFLGNKAGNVVSWSDTQIVATVATGSTSGSVLITQNGVFSNTIPFVVGSFSISSVAPANGLPGTQVTITGNSFGTSQGSGKVWIGTAYATVVSWSNTQIVATLASGSQTGTVQVFQGNYWSNVLTFTVNPVITSVSPGSGPVSATVTISGTNFGSAQGTVTFNGTVASPINWSSSSIVVPVPSGATTGSVVVTANGIASAGMNFTVLPTPNITGLSPTTGAVGTPVTITGTNFGSTGTVTVNGTAANPTNWSPTSIAVPVPTGATTGSVVVTVGGVASNGVNFTVSTIGQLNTSRYQHSATLLNNGKILIAGGVHCATAGNCTYLNSAELYDPIAANSVNTGSMATPRAAPAILLPNGKVLVAGGSTCDYANCGSQATAEIYDPVAGTFSGTGNMQSARDGQTMTLLPDGRVLIAGGEFCSTGGSENRGEPLFGDARLVYASFSPAIISTSCNALQTVEIYNPVSGVFTYAEPMHSARYNAAAIRLADGQVLIVGGSDEFDALYSSEIYDPSTGMFTELANGLGLPRTFPAATLLNNGLVLISGGSTAESPLAPTNSAELYDPNAGAFRFTASTMQVQRVRHTATLLGNGQVLIAGGATACSQSCTSDSSTELYNPASDTFATSQTLSSPRATHSGTVAFDGKAYLIGGIANGTTVASVESYAPATMSPPSLVSIAVTPANPSVLVGETRQMAAVGTFTDSSTQILQSVVWTSSNTDITTIANASGSSGIISPKSVGSSTITATVGNVSGSTLVTVPQLVSLSLYPQNAVITQGESQQLMARATFTDGTVHDQTSVATWSSSDNGVAIVGNDSGRKGLVFGLTSANAMITAAIGSATTTTGVTIVPPASAPPAPFISGMSPTAGGPATVVTITGSGFGSAQGDGIVWLGSTYGSVVSWSDTQVVAAVASGAGSGEVQIEQSGIWSNTYDFVVNAPTISAISPSSGLPGTQITINGSGFGSAPGTAWLGTANGSIVSWSDTQVVATVAPESATGVAQILQSGVLSNPVSFAVNIPHIDDVSPSAGSPGTSVTITGTGFGTPQGTGNLQLGSTNGVVSSWTDTQIIALVAGDAQNGITRVTQNGIASNFKNFSVPPSGTSTNVHITPDIMTMVVGETRTLQALDANGVELHSLTWNLTDSSVANLSTDDPPVLTALAPGHVTITAGDGSADLAVSPDPVLPLGTILWSVPGDGSGVVGIGPAVPSSEGVADVFAYQASGNVQAITANGKVAWSAALNPTDNSLADFQGGLVVQNPTTIKKLDGLTGTAYPAYTYSKPTDPNQGPPPPIAVHTDGTIFTIDDTSVVGIDPKTGIPKFTVSIDDRITWSIRNSPVARRATGQNPPSMGRMIIAGDGNAYVPYEYWTYNNSYTTDQWDPYEEHDKVYLKVLRVGPDGDSQKILVKEWSYDSSHNSLLVIDGVDPYGYFYGCFTTIVLGVPYYHCDYCLQQNGCQRGHTVTTRSESGVLGIALSPWADPPKEGVPASPLIPFGDLITNADQGAVLPVGPVSEGYSSSYVDPPGSGSTTPANVISYLATISSGGASLAKLKMPDGYSVQPVLQREDGTYIGTANRYHSAGSSRMVGVDASGNQKFGVTGDYQPQIATADGGVIAASGYRSAVKFDQNGNATGSVANLPTQSWIGRLYDYGSTEQVYGRPIPFAASLWAQIGANPSGSSTGSRPWFFKLVFQNDFVLYPDDPMYQPALSADITSQAMRTKAAAIAALQRAFDGYPVTIDEGGAHTGDNRANVVNGTYYDPRSGSEACGLSSQFPGSHDSNIYYLKNMEQAQWALPILMSNSQDVHNAMTRLDLMDAIGTGIGNNAAHEIAHQFFLDSYGMDDTSKNTYNGQGCDGAKAAWVYTGVGSDKKAPIHWEDTTEQGLHNALKGGWHK